MYQENPETLGRADQHIRIDLRVIYRPRKCNSFSHLYSILVMEISSCFYFQIND